MVNASEKPNRKRPPVDESRYQVDSLIARRDASRLIGARIIDSSGDDVDIAANRVSHRIKQAIIKGALREEAPNLFRFGELVLWAKSSKGWALKFDGLPCALRNVTSTFTAVGLIGQAEKSGVVCPTGLAECHAEIARLHALLVRAERDLQSKTAELEQIRPLAEKWTQRIVAKNRANAKKPRGKKRNAA